MVTKPATRGYWLTETDTVFPISLWRIGHITSEELMIAEYT